jgi:hypothetical protein
MSPVMAHLIFRFYEVELGYDARVCGEVVLALGVEALDHVLNALVDGALVKDGAEPFEDGVESLTEG